VPRPPKPPNPALDRLILHAIRRQRVANLTERKILALLREVMLDVKRDFERRLAWIATRGYDSSDFTLARLEANLRDLRAILRGGYVEAAKLLRRDLVAAGRLELDVQASVLRATAEAAAAGRVITVASYDLLAAIVDSKPFQGRLLREWAKKMEADGMAALQQAIRRGMALSETPQQIVSRVMGRYDRAAKVYRGGILDGVIRRDVSAVVQTAYAHVAAQARDEFYRKNADLIESVTWLATLDQITCPICSIRDGLRYTLDHKPIGHKVPWADGPGRIHWKCRCEPIPNLIGSENAFREPFREWIGRQSADVQNEVLGVRRARLLRSGKVAFDRFFNDSGKFLTLEQVYRREGVSRAEAA